jgi:hypothetical protein
LLGYDLDRDIALVSIKPGMQITPVAVAPPGHTVRPRDAAFTVGCDKGADATVRQSQSPPSTSIAAGRTSPPAALRLMAGAAADSSPPRAY